VDKTMNILFLDLETTGLNPVVHDIIQLAGLIEIDGELIKEFSFYIRPFNFSTIDETSIKIHGITKEKMNSFPEPSIVFSDFIDILKTYGNEHKYVICGYNIKFDFEFLRSYFLNSSGAEFAEIFLNYSLDIMQIILFFKAVGMISPYNLKLTTIARYFNIQYKKHDALSDIKATREIYNKLKLYIRK
jgi:DNA polymerase-3 subunit epsilon